MAQEYEDFQTGKLYQLSYYLYGVILISLYFLVTNVLFLATSFSALVSFQAGLFTIPFLFIIVILSMIPIGPSWAAAIYTAKTLQEKQFHSVTKNYFKAYKQFFKKSLYTWSVLLGALVVLFFNFWAILSSQTLGFLIYTLFALTAITIAVGIYVFPLLIEYSLGVVQLLKLALYFTFKKLIFSILLVAILLLSVYLLISFPIIFFLVIPGGYALVQYLFCESIFENILAEKVKMKN